MVDADGAPPTALVAQVRDGLLYVFLPPLAELESFVELIDALEIAARRPRPRSCWRVTAHPATPGCRP